ncbi:hypothetical protein EII34_06430 [Arachnia propionica]|uniref:Uncharacterized protein n=1 Tax=Arachnia propionica TaxID=1750 RepID=A0A3P1T787_9ACTN|nr:hypothetical protein [Arachnia propionica]MDO5083535.1 hypothetical protein [Arachnia propionica]RRD05367.1 hypothetical protein EII34_06430 [Arachnia propionica]
MNDETPVNDGPDKCDKCGFYLLSFDEHCGECEAPVPRRGCGRLHDRLPGQNQFRWVLDSRGAGVDSACATAAFLSLLPWQLPLVGLWGLLALFEALAAFCTGCVGLWNVKASGRGGKVLAVLALIISGSFLVLFLFVLSQTGTPSRSR